MFNEFSDCFVYYFTATLILWMLFIATQYISERFEKGIIIKNKLLRVFLWLRKYDEYISYPSLVFVIIGYIEAVLTVVCNVVCLMIPDIISIYVSFGYLIFLLVTWIVALFFLPSYGVRG